MRRREPARVLGPYPQDHQWRIIQIDAKGRRKSHMADSRQAATRLIAKLRADMDARTVEDTLELWTAARLRGGDATPATIADQAARVRHLLGPVLDLRLNELTERKATAIYERATTEPSLKTGRPLSAASHRFYLSIVGYMWKWAQKQGYAKENPWAEVEPIGRVSSGKPQLRPAEARRFAQLAEQEAAAGSELALAALCCLSLGLRASEALGLTGRDIDAEASEVYVSGTKTAAARRRLKVPTYLGTLLGRAAATRHPMDRLCVATRQTLHSTVVAMCARAGVPRVCVHGLRGTHASLAVSGGASVEAVARVLGHTSTKMTLDHYITQEAATDARVAAVDASLSLPNHSEGNSGPESPTGGSTSSSLLTMSAPHRDAGCEAELIHSASTDQAQLPPSGDTTVPRPPDLSRHSAVCCCLRCEQCGTGEQAMRSVGGDYARFLARVASPPSRTVAPVDDCSTPTRKPSRYGAHPMRRREQARVLGPYKEDALWRIIEIDARGRRKSYTVGSRQAATRLMARIRATLGARTVQATIELWGAARLRSGDAYPSTIADQAARVRALLGSVYNLRIGDVTERKALALYEQATQEPSKKTGRPLRPATHRFYLYLAQSMWAWALKQGYVQKNPWAEIEPVGRVSAGKPQLRPPEARRFAQQAEQEAAAGSGLALAALCCLSLGLRASEALAITARDLDLEAGEVYVNGTKTAAAKRRLKVPPYLAALLARAAAPRQPTERLCPASRQGLHAAVVGLCARAGVPRVCVHALRGTHASLAVSGGASVEAVARVLGHTSTKMTLGHYVTEESATAARVAAVDATLSLPHHSDSISDPNSPTGGPTGSLLLSLSTPRQAADSQAPAVSTASRTPDPRRHSAVCCCRLCELRGTGEQAIRSVGGDYRRFLALLDRR